MAKKWFERIRRSGQLTVFNDAGAWSAVVTTAMQTFNAQGFGVQLVAEQDEIKANVVVKISEGTTKYNFYGQDWPVNFNAAEPHGKTLPFVDPDKDVLVKAAVFLPSKLKNVSNDVKVMVTVHELIHAAGLSSNEDHDTHSGVFYNRFNIVQGKMMEILPNKGALPMPPIRVGPQTTCKLKGLWDGTTTC